MRILISGDRKWTDKEAIKNVLENVSGIKYGDLNIFIIEGEAEGADKLGAQAARELGIPERNILKFPAPWGDVEGKPSYQIGTRNDGTKYWKAAGPFRNKQMLTEGKPDLVLAFHTDIANSKGTLDMIKQANKAGIEVRLYAK